MVVVLCMGDKKNYHELKTNPEDIRAAVLQALRVPAMGGIDEALFPHLKTGKDFEWNNFGNYGGNKPLEAEAVSNENYASCLVNWFVKAQSYANKHGAEGVVISDIQFDKRLGKPLVAGLAQLVNLRKI